MVNGPWKKVKRGTKKMNPQKQKIREILKKVVELGKITPEEVKAIEAYLESDGIIDQSEAKLLFRINHALESNHDDCDEWIEFFVTNICRYVVMDMNTPGQIDAEEGDWLAEMFDDYSIDNVAEQALIRDIKKLTSSIDGRIRERIGE